MIAQKNRSKKIELSSVFNYSVLFIIILFFKHIYSCAPIEYLKWIMHPVSIIISSLTGMPFIWEAGTGYVNYDSMIIIARSCAGVNFLLLAFVLLSYRKLKSTSIITGCIVLFISLTIAYLYTLFTNSIRILLAIIIFKSKMFDHIIDEATLHEYEGIAVFFSGLILLQFILELLEKRSGTIKVISLMVPFILYIILTLGVSCILNPSVIVSPRFQLHAVAIIVISLFISVCCTICMTNNALSIKCKKMLVGIMHGNPEINDECNHNARINNE